MIVKIDKSFAKDLAQIKDRHLCIRIGDCIEQVQKADSLSQISSLKKITLKSHYYRIRLGDFRLGIKVDGTTVIFIRALNRKEIYRYFP
jgi:mRNA interferase RelE/StbE